MTNLLATSFFTPRQTAIVIAVAVVGSIMIILNIVLWYVWHRRKERKLYDRILQKERELLMQRLDDMRQKGDNGALVSQSAFFTNTVYVEVPVPSKEATDAVTETVPVAPEAETLTAEIAAPEEKTAEVVTEEVVATAETEEAAGELEAEEEEDVEGGEKSLTDLDEDAEVEEEIIINGRKIRYNRSYTARVIQSTDEFKLRYSDLKNYVLSHTGVKSRVSWKHELFRFGRNSFLRFVVRGKTLCACFAMNPDRFEGSKYNVVDIRKRSPQAKYPTLFKVKGSRSLKQAKELVDMTMAELGLVRGADYVEERYVPAYQPTEELIEAELIKMIGEILLQTNEQPAELSAAVGAEKVEAPVEETTEVAAAEEPAQIAAEEVAVTEAEPAEIVEEDPLPENEPAAVAKEEVAAAEEECVEVADEEPFVSPMEKDNFLPERDFEVLKEIDVKQTEVISNSEAESLIEIKAVKNQKADGKKGIVNVDTLSKNYEAGAYVTVENLREKKLIAKDVKQVKVLAKGIVSKPLIVEANDFSLDAVKMIVLTGGRVIRRNVIE